MPPTNELFPEAKTPTLEADALYGLPGRIIQKLAPQTESHPAAMLVEVLMSFGNVIGHSAYYEVEDTPHYANLFAVKVGRSSKARKGTASARIVKIFRTVDPRWAACNVVSGLSSGEGLIERVKDDVFGDDGKVKIPGVADKRLLVYEGEFSSVLSVSKREGNTLSQLIRCAWDGKPLQTLTRNSPLEATDHHISILGDITNEELQLLLSHRDRFNGFTNRFLWVFVERTRLLPGGGAELDWTDEVAELKEAVAEARKRHRLFFDRNAREKWDPVYEKLSEGRPGTFGAATSRAEAQTIRLALNYALLDQSEHICVQHLDAALAVWRYCDESARLVFGGLSQCQKQIASGLQVQSMTPGEINQRVFSRNLRIPDILGELAGMVALGCVRPASGNKYEWVGDSRLPSPLLTPK
jgi:hypothetical protein